MSKVLYIINSFQVGGAERVMQKLAMNQSPDDAVVVSLTTDGPIGIELRAAGYITHTLNMRLYNFPMVIFRLSAIIKGFSPDIVHTWLYLSDFIGGLTAKLTCNAKIIWSIRTTHLRKGGHATALLRKINAKLSMAVPDFITIVAKESLQLHRFVGYEESKMRYIPNGVDITAFSFDIEQRDLIRAERGWGDDLLVVLMVGRFSDIKGQRDFISAAAKVLLDVDDSTSVEFALLGRGNDHLNTELLALLYEYNIEGFVHLLGEHANVPAFLSAADVFCLPSRSEGFPNALLEAASVGLPSVVTQVGDVKEVVGERYRFMVEAGDVIALSSALTLMLMLDWAERKRYAEILRMTVVDKYADCVMLNAYNEMYLEALE